MCFSVHFVKQTLFPLSGLLSWLRKEMKMANVLQRKYKGIREYILCIESSLINSFRSRRPHWVCSTKRWRATPLIHSCRKRNESKVSNTRGDALMESILTGEEETVRITQFMTSWATPNVTSMRVYSMEKMLQPMLRPPQTSFSFYQYTHTFLQFDSSPNSLSKGFETFCQIAVIKSLVMPV